MVVFHDMTLKRMTGMEGGVTEHTYEELLQYPLGQSEERIPLFSQVLEMVDDRVPLGEEVRVGLR